MKPFLTVFQLQQLVVSGELPCSKEEAATLAGIQLHLDETWPEEDTESGQTEDTDEQLERDRLLKHDRKVSLLFNLLE